MGDDKMNGRTAKQIRNGIYYPKKKRTYQRKPNGQIIADGPRRIYQQTKKNVKRG